MKKSLSFASLLLCAMSTVALAGCRGGNQGEKADYTFKVWTPDAAQAVTKALAEAWAEEIKEADGVKIAFKFEKVSESSAGSDMISDVRAGADLFFFAQDQTARLLSSSCLTEIVAESVKNEITTKNDATSVSAVTVDGKVCAFPLTSDNGYFMYYDKSVFTDATKLDTLEGLIEVANANGRKISWQLAKDGAWYNYGFFYGAGAHSHWTTNAAGKFASYDDTYNSAEGLFAMKAMNSLVRDTAVWQNISSAQEAFAKNAAQNIISAVCISGTWDANNAKLALGENMGVTKLPTMTVDGVTKQIGSFSGCKLLGVKPQEDATKAAYALSLARRISGKEAQLERFNQLGWGPSNNEAKATDAIANDPVLTALNAQNVFAEPQGQYPGDWWTASATLVTTMEGKTYNDTQLGALLNTYEESLDSMLNA